MKQWACFYSGMSEVETCPFFLLFPRINPEPILVRSGPWSLCNQTSSWAEVEGGLKTAVLVHQVCLRRWKHSLRLIPSDFLVTCWAKLCLMNALMGSVYCEECRTGCPRGSRFDIITQICQGQRALLLSALQNCLYHLHRHGYSDMNALLHGRRMTSKPPHPNDNTLCSAYRMKLMRDNDVATGAYVAWEARDMTDFAFEGIKSGRQWKQPQRCSVYRKTPSAVSPGNVAAQGEMGRCLLMRKLCFKCIRLKTNRPALSEGVIS